MPPPKVTCWVCSEIVNKSQTVCTGKNKDGQPMRCCRSHEEACLAEEQQKKQRQVQAMNQVRFQNQQKLQSERLHPHIPSGLECWHCHKQVITGREHHMRMLITHEKMQMKGASPFDIQTMKQEYGPVTLIGVFVAVKETDILSRQTQDGMTLCQMSNGHLFICQECAKKYGLLKEWQQALCPAMEHIPMTEVLTLGTLLYETTGLKQIVQTVAELEVNTPSAN